MAIWDEAAKGSARFDTTEPASYSADSKKCKNCGSNLYFDTVHKVMTCGNCGSVFDPETFDKLGSFGLANPEKEYDGKIEMSADDMRRQEIVCNACGAQIVTDKNTASTFCAFCGSPAIVSRRLTREFRPDCIIPFAFDKDQAVSKFKEHAGEVDHLPKGYINDQALSKMTGLYIPVWIISTEIEVFLNGVARVGHMTDDVYVDSGLSSSGSMSATNYSRRIYAKVKFRLKDVPFDGQKKLPDRLMSAAEPFDYTELVPFRPEYLQGYFAEKYDELPLDMTDKIYRRLDKYALEFSDALDFGYDRFTPDYNASRTRYSNQSIKYALLPIWFLTLEHKGIRYQYIVNGQTGKVSGDFPYAKGWETVDRTKKRAKMKTVSLNTGIRASIYGLTSLLLCIGLPMLIHPFAANYIAGHPFESLMIFLLIGLLIYFLTVQLPKLLIGVEKNSIDKLSEAGSHELDKEQDYTLYFDTTYATEAYETTMDFAPLDEGWKYGEKKFFDFKNAMPEGEDIYEEDASGTEFEKQGHGRRMME